jgi:hypothetical protein
VYFSSSRDQKRVFEFVEKFFDGDPNGTFQKALRHYYKNKFSSDTDREKIEHLIKLVETDLSALPSKRKGLEPQTAAKAEASKTTSPSLAAVKRELGKNFLGPEEWKAQGIEVGATPPIPISITKALLNSECPLHPGQKIKDTHVLMLVPKTVNGDAYTPLKLNELCAGRKGSGDKLIDDGADWTKNWQRREWAKVPQAESEWVLIPKSDPDPKVSPDKHFRGKKIAAQKGVHDSHYKEYREVKTLELMTMAVLYDFTHKERLLSDCYLRCEEPNASGGRVCVGRFDADGLVVSGGGDDRDYVAFGRALAWKL